MSRDAVAPAHRFSLNLDGTDAVGDPVAAGVGQGESHYKLNPY